MRIDPVTLEAMRAAIAPLDTEDRRQAYREGRFPRAALVKDLDTRYRWDLVSASRAYRLAYDIGANDSHIETALKRIVPPLA